MKYILLTILLFIENSFGYEQQIVPISIKNINFKEEISKDHYKIVEYNDLNRKIYNIKCKEYLSLEDLKSNSYRAKHYIKKNRVICKKSLYITSSKKIKFNFGSIEIEKDGEIIKETSKYIRIKNADGTVEKIYKGVK